MAGMSLILGISGLNAQQLRVYPAAELEFATETFRQYQLQGSVDLAGWMNVGSPFAGTGEKITRFITTRESGLTRRVSRKKSCDKIWPDAR